MHYRCLDYRVQIFNYMVTCSSSMGVTGYNWSNALMDNQPLPILLPRNFIPTHVRRIHIPLSALMTVSFIF